MDENNQNPYYPITDRQRYPALSPENGDVHARPNQNVDLQFQHQQLQMQHEELQTQYNQLQMQHNDLQTKHNGLQSNYNRLKFHVRRDPLAFQRVIHAWKQDHDSSLVEHDDEYEAPVANAAPVADRRYITRSIQKTEPVVKGERKTEPVVKKEYQVASIIKEEPKAAPFVKQEPVEDEHFRPTPDREYAPSSAGSSDEDMEDRDYEPTPAPVAPATFARLVTRPATIAPPVPRPVAPPIPRPVTRLVARSVARPLARPATAAPPATVAPHELRFIMKKDRESNMSIYHRKEFAYCEIAMTEEEYCHVKRQTYVAPQTLSTPDNNGKTEGRWRLRITWVERDRLNAWRVRHGRKPHEICEGTKYAAARDFWRFNPPLAVEPRRTVEWNMGRGDLPAI
ncbi:hypothetical protein BPOR_0337g00020 [Botrytis porri]|uniref:Uncharacterized protein n=1 Tax=Botrytis porri TaxID=87229 RepID=A0A4Z1KJ44_9HELO|nr:hypothetical protein BPOR_0337g00020 [Botrytis porri]